MLTKKKGTKMSITRTCFVYIEKAEYSTLTAYPKMFFPSVIAHGDKATRAKNQSSEMYTTSQSGAVKKLFLAMQLYS